MTEALIQLSASDTMKPIYVRPSAITVVRECTYGTFEGSTEIGLQGFCALFVHETVDQVVAKINKVTD